MKIERLLKILVYLFNHKRVSAGDLAQRYNVSLRTIQRDIDTLTLAGFPIVAYTGFQGGYEIMDAYKLPIQLADDQDYQSIIVALHGLQTALGSTQIDATLEKLKSLTACQESPIALDLSAMHENFEYNSRIQIWITAIQEKKQVCVTYRNVQGKVSKRILEPLLLQYRWYAWYGLAYDTTKQDYRRFKIARMEEIVPQMDTFQNHHASIADIQKGMEMNTIQDYVDFDVRCQACDAAVLNEYLNGTCKRQGDQILLHLHLPKAEWQWKGRLLAMGNRIEILNHDELKAELCQLCHEFLNNHEQGDIPLS